MIEAEGIFEFDLLRWQIGATELIEDVGKTKKKEKKRIEISRRTTAIM